MLVCLLSGHSCVTCGHWCIVMQHLFVHTVGISYFTHPYYGYYEQNLIFYLHGIQSQKLLP
jgi:hypothetical protein